MTINDIIKFLNSILLDKNSETRRMLVIGFNNYMFNHNGIIQNESIDDILIELAHDLEYYEPNPEYRSQDPSFYNDEKLEENIKQALFAIEKVNNS